MVQMRISLDHWHHEYDSSRADAIKFRIIELAERSRKAADDPSIAATDSSETEKVVVKRISTSEAKKKT
jgi:hypothetical protein